MMPYFICTYIHIFVTSRISARFVNVTCELLDIIMMKILFAHMRARFSKRIARLMIFDELVFI